MLLDNNAYEFSTKPIAEGGIRYKCKRVQDDTEFIASFMPLDGYKKLKAVGIEELQAIPHDNLLKVIHQFTFNDTQGIFKFGKEEKMVTIYETFKGMLTSLHCSKRRLLKD